MLKVAGQSVKLPLLILSSLSIEWKSFLIDQLKISKKTDIDDFFADLDVMTLTAKKLPDQIEKKVINNVNDGMGLLLLGGWGGFTEFDFGESLLYEHVFKPHLKLYPQSIVNSVSKLSFETNASKEIFTSIYNSTFPPIGGYSKVKVRTDDIDVLVEVQGDPIIMTFSYGKGKIMLFTSDLDGGWPMRIISSKDFSYISFVSDIFRFLSSKRVKLGLGMSNKIKKFNPILSFLLEQYIKTREYYWIKDFCKNIQVPVQTGTEQLNYKENTRYWKNVFSLLSDLCRYTGNYEGAFKFNKKLMLLQGITQDRADIEITRANQEKILLLQKSRTSTLKKAKKHLKPISSAYTRFSEKIKSINRKENYEKYLVGKEFAKSYNLYNDILDNILNLSIEDQDIKKFIVNYNTKGPGINTLLKVPIKSLIDEKEESLTQISIEFIKQINYGRDSEVLTEHEKVLIENIIIKRIMRKLMLDVLLLELDTFYEKLSVIFYVNKYRPMALTEIVQEFKKLSLVQRKGKKERGKVSIGTIRRRLEQNLRDESFNKNGKEFFIFKTKISGKNKRYLYMLNEKGISFIEEKIKTIIKIQI